MRQGIQKLLRIGRNTRDLDRALAFYRDALGFCVDDADAPPPAWTRLPGIRAAAARNAQLSLGVQQLVLTEFPDGAPYAVDSTSCDLCFQHCAIVVDDMDAAHRRALQYGAVPITRGGPQTLPPSTGAVTAWKFRDPDGHPLELIRFPPGTGDPDWQRTRGSSPMLGIDHSAISVTDVGRSIRFYELLGLRVAARGVNRGAEQQGLDALDDAEVDVVAMQATARTPHLELLGYRQPRGRASAAIGLAAVAADRLVWQALPGDVPLDALADADFTDTVVAEGVVDRTILTLLRDPDGHMLLLIRQGVSSRAKRRPENRP